MVRLSDLPEYEREHLSGEEFAASGAVCMGHRSKTAQRNASRPYYDGRASLS